MFRRDGPSSKALHVKRSFTAKVPTTASILQYCKDKAPKFDYQEISLTLTVNGKMEEREYRDLLSLYPGQANVHAEIKRLYTESQLYLSDDDLSALETYAKRIRGEVLFARGMVIV